MAAVTRLNLRDLRDGSFWNTLIGLNLVGYLEDRSRTCALLRFLFMVCFHLAIKSPHASPQRSNWMHIGVFLLGTLAVIHVLGAAPAPLMIHFVQEEVAMSRFALLVCDGSIFLYVFFFMLPAMGKEEQPRAQQAAPLHQAAVPV